ncbi:MAG: sigma factor-like helix-turn-helix DNA-binding protein [Solirubrobacteraceae bacterium]
MDEVHEFCQRVLGAGAAAADAAVEARAGAKQGIGRVEMLAAAARACRARAGLPYVDQGVAPEGESHDLGLTAAVARELAQANAGLPERQREALVLRELLRLSYEEMSQVMGVEEAPVAALLARARLALRVERRGVSTQEGADCAERDRALRVLARRHDSESLSGEDDEWLLDHLGVCPRCIAAHAAMLEASACYRAWPAGSVPGEAE